MAAAMRVMRDDIVPFPPGLLPHRWMQPDGGEVIRLPMVNSDNWRLVWVKTGRVPVCGLKVLCYCAVAATHQARV